MKRGKQRATVICRRGARILLVTRAGRRWALPGGALKRGESPVEAALRELREETALAGLTLVYVLQFAGLQKLHHVFLAEVPGGMDARPCSEISRCRWVDPCRARALPASVPTREIVALLGARSPR
ncbi:NUDIX hydrolase [Burkholderia plantarii]|uniref:NUDIX hydrolase n=1 Tax=Burkholderia plantarii TaxID=41899 RepID=UPI0018DBF6BA|nr:NUDIX domain-containing protein [Burkholderia plantarii]MBI0331788.1 NUDIX domain-containing protein [Burkholderia plantarii]